MIPLSRPWITEEEINNVNEVFKSGNLSQGKQVEKFEEKTAQFLGVAKDNVIAVSSGTTALHLCGILLSSKLEQRIIHIPATTFISTANMINYLDMEMDTTIHFDDIESNTWNMVPHDGYKITVDLFGNSNQYKYLKDVLVEDAAQAFGSEYEGNKCGTFAPFGAFSFFENKTISTGGEGGLIFAKDRRDADMARLLRQQGKDFTMENHVHVGYNYRMTEMQAAFGVAQMNKINEIIKRKRDIHELYKAHLQDAARFQHQIGKPCPWLTCVKFNSKEKRDKIKEILDLNKVQTRLPFPPVYYNPPYNGYKTHCPVAENLYETGLCLPNYPELKEEEVKMICKYIRDEI